MFNFQFMILVLPSLVSVVHHGSFPCNKSAHFLQQLNYCHKSYSSQTRKLILGNQKILAKSYFVEEVQTHGYRLYLNVSKSYFWTTKFPVSFYYCLFKAVILSPSSLVYPPEEICFVCVSKCYKNNCALSLVLLFIFLKFCYYSNYTLINHHSKLKSSLILIWI